MPYTPVAHTLSTFDEALSQLQSMVLTMASYCHQNVDNASKGLLERDRDACLAVITDEEEINHLEKSVDRLGLEIITRFQPLATDLRVVISNMRLSSNLERVGDLCDNIARRSLRMIKEIEIEETKIVEPLFDLARKMLHNTIIAFNDADVDLANEVIRSDKELDQEEAVLKATITEKLANCTNSKQTAGYVDLLFILRALERIGDHSKNISEDAIFISQAIDIRHGNSLSE